MSIALTIYKTTNIFPWGKDEQTPGEIKVVVKGDILPIIFSRVDHIEENMGSWSNNYGIINWFVLNLQQGEMDQEQHYFQPLQIKPFLELCLKIKAAPEDVEQLLWFDEENYLSADRCVRVLQDIDSMIACFEEILLSAESAAYIDYWYIIV
jgi:hypothetical protein